MSIARDLLVNRRQFGRAVIGAAARLGGSDKNILVAAARFQS